MVVASPLLTAFLICAASWGLLRLLRRRFLKSPLDNIPGPAPTSLWQGNVSQYFHRHGSDFHRHLAQDYGSVVKLYGLYCIPMLIVQDPKALHNILIKEEGVFEESKLFIKTNHYLFGPGLISTLGEHHHKQRKMLNSVFAINHMRSLVPTFYGIVHKLQEALTTEVQSGPRELNILFWMGRAALELVGQGGLGYSFDPLVRDAEDDYGEALKTLFPTLQGLIVFRQLLPYVDWIGPRWFRAFVMDHFPHAGVRKLKYNVDKMSETATAIFRAKKEALGVGLESDPEQIGGGKDIMTTLVKANMAASDSDRLPDDELVAQMSTIILGAMDTTSNILSRTLQNLAARPEMQDRLRNEVMAAYSGEDLTYDEVMQLPYLDAVCRETLRLYPPVTFLTRVAKRDAVLPLHFPVVGRNGQTMSEIHVPKGTKIILGTLGSNTSKAKWGEDALEWKPERWLAPLPRTVTDVAAPGVFSHFGFKFSELEMKILLMMLLSNFTFALSDKPIVWNLAPISFPSVGMESSQPSMPLIVTPLRKNEKP
ncbi:hypothetical protein POSPLADRAFT_1048841 [Postia placenta MAD-698-R-SB12]|uniref:Cytochrome P450 n=1 Tax=Postia placenta MAD-698-R-SB12 TaxID=670580 RepID=A0A1X6MT88_9APHY|nr:hypothetical protein POSPLADRAFT_1048841 [Postia placenta MAD-698-R-SB12]OSX59529.1 hypothetical protein POSPLADRAFT_1048841 [Postia placenta MAD-698-R-SB12]